MRKLKIIFSCILLMLFSGQLFGQTDTTKLKNNYDEDNAHFILSGGLSYQKQLAGEIGFIYGYSDAGGVCNPGGVIGLKLASEFNFNSSNFFIAPKLAFECDFLMLGIRLNIIDYTDFTYHDLKFTPEIGLSLSGAVNLLYGYNFSLTDKRIDNVGTNRITLTINYDKVLWGQ